MGKSLTTAVALLTLPLALASAQADGPRQVLSIQPLSAMFGVYSAEFERAAGAAVTWGIGATYWGSGFDNGDSHYTSAEFKLRGYPSGAALTGFSVGGAVGYTSVGSNDGYGSSESIGGPTVAVLLEYQWLMGIKKEWAFALGLGAKKLIIDDKSSGVSFTGNYPTARISIGYAWK